MKKVVGRIVIGLLIVGGICLTSSILISRHHASATNSVLNNQGKQHVIEWNHHRYWSKYTIDEIRTKNNYHYTHHGKQGAYQDKYLGITNNARSGFYTKNPSESDKVHYRKYRGHFALFETFDGVVSHEWHYVNLQNGTVHQYSFDEFFLHE